MRKILFVFTFFISTNCFSQGLNNFWLLGYDTAIDPPYSTSTRATIDFSSGVPSVTPTSTKMPFDATQGNISDANGNLLIYSNGIWIANATDDTMMNGSGLSPGQFTFDWRNYGLPIPSGNLIILFPGDSSKYVMFHMTANYNLNLQATELYYSLIDMNLDNGLGGVVQKNQIVLQDTLSWGIGACKHANGRDWWVVVIKDNSDLIYKILLTPTGIDTVTVQSLNVPPHLYNSTQLVFSPDGSKFAYIYSQSSGAVNWIFNTRLFDFDRCAGALSNSQFIDLTDSSVGIGVCFSPNSKYLFAASTNHIFQINTDSTILYVDTVATYDGYFSPVGTSFASSFLLMYPSSDGRIYLTSGSSVVDLNYINYPDSAGIACDVHQHALHLPCFNLRTVPNHPNYFLGPVLGSVCDSLLHVGIEETIAENSHLKLYPNPTQDFFWLEYDLTNSTGNGELIIYNIYGEAVLRKTLYNYFKTVKVECSNLSSGIYALTITKNKSVIARGKFVKQ